MRCRCTIPGSSRSMILAKARSYLWSSGFQCRTLTYSDGLLRTRPRSARMQPFRLISVFILILLLGAVVAAACTNDGDGASTAAETQPPSAPTPDVEGIVETAVREALGAIPTPTPAPTPDIEAIVVHRSLQYHEGRSAGVVGHQDRSPLPYPTHQTTVRHPMGP